MSAAAESVPVAARVQAVKALLASGATAAAEQELLALLAEFPEDDDILNALGTIALDRGDNTQAVAWFEQALARNPVRVDTLSNLGVAAHTRGDLAGAENYYRQTLALAPGFTQAAFQLGQLLAALQRMPEAYEIWWAAGREMVAAGRALDAAVIFTELVKLAPRDSDALGVLGSLYLDLEQFDKAQTCFERVLQLDRDNAGACNALGLLNARAGHNAEAARLFRRALERQRIFPEARNNLGNLYARLGRSDDAVKNYRMAVAQQPDYADAWINLADELMFIGDRAEALAACERCLELLPEHPLAHLRRGYLRLAAGDDAGWADHEWRIAAQTGASYYPDPGDDLRLLPRPSTWAATDLTGKRLLLLAEEGIGDEIFCLRFAPALRARGVHLSYRPSAKLQALLARADALDAVLDAQAPWPAFDYALAVGDLPLVALAQGCAALPTPLPLRADPAQVEAMRGWLAVTGPPPYLGVTWRAGRADDAARRKEIEVEALARALASWPGTLVAMQRGVADGELARLARSSGRPLADACFQADDVDAMAALLAVLDDYVGVSNTNMHVQGSLGRHGKVLVRAAAEWRWRHAGTHSPWYPNLELYREQGRGGWHEALARLHDAIQRP